MVAIILVLSLVSSASADPSDPWWDNDWGFRTPLTVTGASATDGVQAQVTITYDSDMQSDFNDLRFVEADGVTTIPYWVESKIDGTSATVWLKLPASEITVYQYYGNATVASGSNGDAVFLIFDDFNGATLNTSKWTATKLGSTSAVVEHDGAGNLRLAGKPATSSSGSVVSVQTFARGVQIDYRDKIDNIYYADVSIGSGALQGESGDTSYWHSRLASGYLALGQVTDGSTDNSLNRAPTSGALLLLATSTAAPYPNQNTYYLHTFRWDTANNLVWTRDGTQVAAASDSTYAANTMRLALSQGEHSTGLGGNRYIDWVRVRQYVATSPTLTMGAEESYTPSSPVAAFTANVTSGTVPLAVQFTDASTGTPTSWSWTFGDGATSTAQSPAHTYAAAGTYTVSLTTTNAYGEDTETKSNYITVWYLVPGEDYPRLTWGGVPDDHNIIIEPDPIVWTPHKDGNATFTYEWSPNEATYISMWWNSSNQNLDPDAFLQSFTAVIQDNTYGLGIMVILFAVFFMLVVAYGDYMVALVMLVLALPSITPNLIPFDFQIPLIILVGVLAADVIYRTLKTVLQQ